MPKSRREAPDWRRFGALRKLAEVEALEQEKSELEERLASLRCRSEQQKKEYQELMAESEILSLEWDNSNESWSSLAQELKRHGLPLPR